MKFAVNWEAGDGYVGGSRPQTFRLDIDSMAEDCETEAEALTYLDDEVRTDFEQKVSYYLKNQAEVLEAWRAARERITHADEGKHEG